MDKPEQAKKNMQDGYNCAQAVFLAFADELGVDRDTAARAAAGFGGGIGRTGNTCGAVSGAIMALGMKYGGTAPDDKEAKERTYAYARSFIEKFESLHGSVTCLGLLCHDIGDPDGIQKVRELGLFQSRCPMLVHSAAEITRELLTTPQLLLRDH